LGNSREGEIKENTTFQREKRGKAKLYKSSEGWMGRGQELEVGQGWGE
jgi:hypothetical protein